MAEKGRLADAKVLDAQVRRLLADPKSKSLVTSFAFQWLRVRAIDNIDPDAVVFPNFDDGLREAFRTEIELFVESILREDRSVLDLLTADHTFVNERLALHYGIPNVRGERFRRVTLTDANRWGLLGKGQRAAGDLVRQSHGARAARRLDSGEHPRHAAGGAAARRRRVPGKQRRREGADRCARSWSSIAPILRATPATASWIRSASRSRISTPSGSGDRRIATPGRPSMPSGKLVDGTAVGGPADLRKALMKRPEQFVQTVTEKLMTYALGRSVEYYDMPAVRAIVRDAARDNYRFSSIVMGIVRSAPFQMGKPQKLVN